MLNTISEARAPFTKRLYALKWSVLSMWCLDHGENPSYQWFCPSCKNCWIKDVPLPHSRSIYIAAIAASYAPIAGQSLGRNTSAVRFLRGTKRLYPPLPLTVLTWDLPTVLMALKGPPFEPLQSITFRSLSLKTALLLALALIKRVGDLQVLSISPAYLEFSRQTTPRPS